MSFQMNSGRSDCCPLNGFMLVVSDPNAVSNAGAVSPMPRATVRMAAVTRPARAVGRTTLSTTRHCGAPSASDASRNASGIVRRISSAVRVIVGSINTMSAAEHAAPEKPRPFTQIVNTSNPATMLGSPLMASTMKRMGGPRRPLISWR